MAFTQSLLTFSSRVHCSCMLLLVPFLTIPRPRDYSELRALPFHVHVAFPNAAASVFSIHSDIGRSSIILHLGSIRRFPIQDEMVMCHLPLHLHCCFLFHPCLRPLHLAHPPCIVERPRPPHTACSLPSLAR